MPKPDFALRSRPLKDVEECLKKLKSVILFHPDELAMKVEAKYCVCGHGEHKSGQKSHRMIQCVDCHDWFHEDCVELIGNVDLDQVVWKCEWCSDAPDKIGMQRWRTGRKRPKLRHLNDRPIVAGVGIGEDKPQTFTEPKQWEGKMIEIKEISRRKSIKKRKLEESVQELMDKGGHHMVDAEGQNGLELRPVDDTLIDEMVGAGIINPESEDDN
jgi:hypothetical protein